MHKKYMVNPVLCALASAAALLFLICAASLLNRGYYSGAAPFGLMGAAFAWIGARYGSWIHLTQDGITQKLLGFTIWHRSWEQLQEVGICGTKLFGRHDRGHYGTLYFYFSDEPLDDDARFQMVLKWPPRKQGILMYRFDRLRWVQYFWSKPLVTYNAGDMDLSEIVDH